ncbi:MAG: hypothetical protein F4X87_12455, partial [Chloroflexi bacterium]|nr:hypothetical protein [Chloroflexota bacterium]
MEILDVIRLLLFALYAPICFVVYRRLYPRLSQMSKRLATAMLAAQVLIIALSTAFYDYSGFTFWLWDLDTEYNIPATLASAQLALAASVALLTLWQAKSRPAWQRVYFVGIAILFFHFARDEFFQFRQSYWLTSYTQLGIAVALATACLHLRVKRQQRAWSLSILAGLALGGFGAIYLESLRGAQSCVAIGFYDHECLIYFLEEALEFLGMWLVLVGLLGFFSDDAPKPGRRWRIVYWLPVFWMLIHHAPHIVTYIGLPYSPHLAALVRYESGVELRMSRLSHDESVLSAQLYATSPNWTTYMGLGYSIHLVDQVSGASAAGADAHASRSYPAPYPYSLFGFRGWQNTYMQQLNIDIARGGGGGGGG